MVAALADRFKLTPEELAQLLPSGTQGIFSNRTQWATSCLRNAGLLETTGRGRLRITAEGQSVVAEKPTRVDIKSPMRYPAGCRRHGDRVGLCGADPPGHQGKWGRQALETMIRWSHEQGMISRRFPAEELFAPSTLEDLPGYI